MKKSILVFFLFLMMPCQVNAEPTIYGPGKQTCAHYVRIVEGHHRHNEGDSMEYLVFIGWFTGFATAVTAQTSEDVLHGRDRDSITLWLENYCKEHPFDNYFSASMKLLNALEKK